MRYQQLDILHCLRGFCALYVVVFHAKFILWAGGRQYLEAHPRAAWSIADYLLFGLDLLSSAGYQMVIFFFVLSGFFIRYAQHKKHRSAGAFYLNRVERIYPPFITSLLLAAGVLTLLATQVPQVLTTTASRELNTTLAQAWAELRAFDLAGAVRTLGFVRLGQHFLGDNVVYWSLLPEGLFYLLVPLALRWIRWYYAASVGLFIVGLYLDWRDVQVNELAHFAVTYNAYFAAGIALYDIVITTTWLTRVAKMPRWLMLPGLGGLLLGLVALSLLKLTTASTVVAGVLAVLAVSVLLAGHIRSHNLLVRGLHKIGEFSFSLYLYHYPLLLLFYAGIVLYTGKLFIYSRIYWGILPIIVAIAYALYYVTERPSVNFFRRR
ncbi:acyltransferase [Hymenobacter sp. RP-2-7]|uniref:Acyltransferase n=1 Tax=Hymenobacter polaris TaxID=2682546 RepID=A0A7Y0AIP9_9BACT|nr:acyltransferase family protein [Hymenobacter polaris]NML68073.1 acyltransferase [Hymenobacter polaris]